MIYLDNATATRPSDQVVAAMTPYLQELWGNPTAPHDWGQRLLPSMEEHLESLYRFLGADDEDTVVITSSGAEAINHVLMGAYYEVTRETGQNHFITSSVDEAPVIMGMGRLEQLGCTSTLLEVGAKGYLSREDVANAITPRTALISLSLANALTGVLHPVWEIAEVCKERGILFHLDLTQVVGRMDFDLKELGADLVTFSADTLHGPRGTGVLWIREGVPFPPLIIGGAEQGGYRAGGLCLGAVAGLAQAANEAEESLDFMGTEVARLRDLFEDELQAAIPDAHIFYQEEERLPNICAVAFPKVSNEALMYRLNRAELYACMGGGSFQQIALVLEAAEVEPGLSQCALSFCLSRETTEEEIVEAVQVIAKAVESLRKISEACFAGKEDAL